MADLLEPSPGYGLGEATFLTAEGAAGFRWLEDDVHEIMGPNPAYASIFGWHPDDIVMLLDKLA